VATTWQQRQARKQSGDLKASAGDGVVSSTPTGPGLECFGGSDTPCRSTALLEAGPLAAIAPPVPPGWRRSWVPHFPCANGPDRGDEQCASPRPNRTTSDPCTAGYSRIGVQRSETTGNDSVRPSAERPQRDSKAPETVRNRARPASFRRRVRSQDRSQTSTLGAAVANVARPLISPL
jgi:hypothetical protein